jgi:hypothetical protein
LRNFERRLGGYLLLSAILGIVAGYGQYRFWTRANMRPLEKLYLRQYFLGSLKAAVSAHADSRYTLLTSQYTDANGRKATGGVTDDQVHPVRDARGRPVRNARGYVFAWNPPNQKGDLSWQKIKLNDRLMCTVLRKQTYQGASFFAILLPSLISGLLVSGGATAGFIFYDVRQNRKYERGTFVRGTRHIEPENYELRGGRPGLGTPSLRIGKRTLRDRLRSSKPVIHWLRIPREEESSHTTLLGDTGTGKSQLIHIFLRQIAGRAPSEPAIVYDPAGEFLAAHYNEARGDIVLNPLDSRCPFWTPTSEIRLITDLELIAESFFPGGETQRAGTSEFFLKAARSIFARLIEFNPTPGELIAWLTDEEAIDERVKGTELIHLIDRRAPQQRGGVLGTLSEAGKQLKLLPSKADCSGEIALTEWAEKRQGWIFVTSTQDTRSQLRPLHSIFLDLLMKRLMASDPSWGVRHPCWLIVDEAHVLGRLPALYTALTEGRKFGIKLILGTQNKNQFEEKYGRGAATMLSAPVLKIVFRCNEPDSARWVSELIGEAEWEKPRIGTTASVEDRGRDSLHYSNHLERKPVVSREEIMSLPKLNGYWKYQDMVVPFKFNARKWPSQAERFLPHTSLKPGIAEKEQPDKHIPAPQISDEVIKLAPDSIGDKAGRSIGPIGTEERFVNEAAMIYSKDEPEV